MLTKTSKTFSCLFKHLSGDYFLHVKLVKTGTDNAVKKNRMLSPAAPTERFCWVSF